MFTAFLLALASSGGPAGGSTGPGQLASPGLSAAAEVAPVDFNWIIPQGQVVVFDTVMTIVNGVPVEGGVIAVHDLHVQPGALLRIQGPNPFVVTAFGSVKIEGTIDASGMGNPGVASLNSTSVPEPGAPGQAGGGQGGVGSPLTTQPSPRGGTGFGAFASTDGGGGGGETGWSSSSNINLRRGAGGGGGAFGRNEPDPNGVSGIWDQSRIGADVEPGFDNTLADNGALGGSGPSAGGVPGPRPFVDGDRSNDFYGVALEASGELIHGELETPWAGAGGGGGGDASKVPAGGTWPPPFSPFGDEKGAGGGGGGGSIHVLAMGPIVFGPLGEIKAKGGTGGGGENTIFLNRVGGGSGGGSGGHVVLETAAWIDLSQSAGLALNALGGQGGAGALDVGGAFLSSSGQKQTKPKKDACPSAQELFASSPCLGLVDGAGGDGGPGLVQLHVPEGALLLPPGQGLADLSAPAPICSDGSCRLLPFAVVPAGHPLTWAASRRLGEALLWRVGGRGARPSAGAAGDG